MVEQRRATFPELSGHFGTEGEFGQQTKEHSSEGTIVFTNEKHIPMKDQLVRKNRGGKTRKLRDENG